MIKNTNPLAPLQMPGNEHQMWPKEQGVWSKEQQMWSTQDNSGLVPRRNDAMTGILRYDKKRFNFFKKCI
jgi:hypothetical protein